MPKMRKRQITVPKASVEDRLKAFDQATERQRRRQRQLSPTGSEKGRGWRREDLYLRAQPR